MNDRHEVTVESCDGRASIAWLRLKNARLAARPWQGIRVREKAVIVIPPEDVVLCLGHPGPTSARNVLPGHVARVHYVSEGVYVTVQVGFPLTAMVTRRAIEELRLKRGSAVFALIKATAIRPHFELEASIRVSLAGKRGSIDPQQIDFMRAIRRTGSLSAAARSVGTTYRTAWTRAQAINRAWGAPLVAKLKGGKGGGGTRLTPAGEAVVERIDSAYIAIREKAHR